MVVHRASILGDGDMSWRDLGICKLHSAETGTNAEVRCLCAGCGLR